MKITVLSLFPEIFEKFFSSSIIGRACEKKLLEVQMCNILSYADGAYKKNVDDSPYGGGAGMLLKPEPLFRAVEDIKTRDKNDQFVTILMTPQGRRLTQKIVESYLDFNHMIIICGRYEGVDERVRLNLVDHEISLGDYLLTGGELAAMALSDAVVRLIPGVLGDSRSHNEESFCEGLLEYPQYTRPAEYRGMKVPEILLSGHHKNVSQWRREQSLERTFLRRPDLLEQANLSERDELYIDQLREKQKKH
ncbi:tRNA (guanosine(37)-N1)-methyltransferase TrmD [PVC group bacterium (ex Bugula neritina AB1)]|nr:tRNA (guanosine(37)-N1)-methyltransferase TrmD [PVC group bacterium (ex Bugula neritina AB1)]